MPLRCWAGRRTLVALCAAACVLVPIVGCGEKSNRPATYPVRGRVTLKGKPVEGAIVQFHRTDQPGGSLGYSDADGVYSLMTFGSNDGACAGEYKVEIIQYEPVPPALQDSPRYANPKNLLPPQYASTKTSGLTATVQANHQGDIDFDLK